MGTNIYARINPPKAEREKLVKRLEEVIMRNDLRVHDEIEELISTYKHDYAEVHLGKRSGEEWWFGGNSSRYDHVKERNTDDEVVEFNELNELEQ